MTTQRRHSWSVTPRDGRRFSRTAWKYVVRFALFDPDLGYTVAFRTERGHARTRRGRRRIAQVLAR